MAQLTQEELSQKVHAHVSQQVSEYLQRNDISYREAAERWGMKPTALQARLRGKTNWKLEEVIWIGYQTGVRLIYKSNK